MIRPLISSLSFNEIANYAKIITQDNFKCKVLNMRYLGGGFFGYVFLIDIDKDPHRLITKACKLENMCSKEAMSINLLRKDSPIYVPEVYCTVKASENIPIDFLCEEYINASNLKRSKWLFLSAQKKKEFANRIVETMLFWHNKTNKKFGDIGSASFNTWNDYYRPTVLDILKTAKSLCENGKLKIRVFNIMELAYSQYDYIFSEPIKQAALVHGDLHIMNILVDKNMNPVALIDPFDSKWGDREYDLFQLKNLWGNSLKLYETYKEHYEVSNNCDIKCAFYALFNEIYCGILIDKFEMKYIWPLAKRLEKLLRSVNQ